MSSLDVCETFTSIQGESSYAGWPCLFVRLAGCNLRCRYCDTRYAWNSGTNRTIEEVVAEWQDSRARMAELTGGEPLLQDAVPELASALHALEKGPVLVETNGSLDISRLPDGVVAIMDIKTPGSGEAESFDYENVGRLRPDDEVKFVLVDRSDYEWAREFVERETLAARCGCVLFGSAGDCLCAADLARWILEDGLPVRLQGQLHRLLGLP